MFSPEIINNLLLEFLLVSHKLGIKEATAFKGVFMKHSPAESVYGKYGRLIKASECFIQSSQCSLRILYFSQ